MQCGCLKMIDDNFNSRNRNTFLGDEYFLIHVNIKAYTDNSTDGVIKMWQILDIFHWSWTALKKILFDHNLENSIIDLCVSLSTCKWQVAVNRCKINNKLSFLIAMANQRFMFIAVECSLACNCVHVLCSYKSYV